MNPRRGTDWHRLLASDRVGPTKQTLKYVGAWVDGKGRVTVTRGAETLPLAPWHDVALICDTCFCWGYEGPAPAQLALALLADYFSELGNGDKLALRHHEAFHREAIARLPEAWVITGDQIEDFIALHEL